MPKQNGEDKPEAAKEMSNASCGCLVLIAIFFVCFMWDTPYPGIQRVKEVYRWITR